MKRQYLTIIIVIAVILLGVIFLLNARGNSQDNQSGATDEIPADVVQITLDDKNESGMGGLGYYKEVGGKAEVEFNLFATGPVRDTYKAHIRSGTCGEPGDILYPLQDAVNGESETFLDMSLDELKAKFPLIVTASASDDVSSLVVCGYLDHPTQ